METIFEEAFLELGRFIEENKSKLHPATVNHIRNIIIERFGLDETETLEEAINRIAERGDKLDIEEKKHLEFIYTSIIGEINGDMYPAGTDNLPNVIKLIDKFPITCVSILLYDLYNSEEGDAINRAIIDKLDFEKINIDSLEKGLIFNPMIIYGDRDFWGIPAIDVVLSLLVLSKKKNINIPFAMFWTKTESKNRIFIRRKFGRDKVITALKNGDNIAFVDYIIIELLENPKRTERIKLIEELAEAGIKVVYEMEKIAQAIKGNKRKIKEEALNMIRKIDAILKTNFEMEIMKELL